MNQIIMYIMAAGAVLGGLDCIFGNRLGLGKRFEEGFNLLGPVALGQAGIICLAPVLSNALGPIVSQAYHALRQDPGMFGSIFAIDMGGFQMSALLADRSADRQLRGHCSSLHAGLHHYLYPARGYGASACGKAGCFCSGA